MTRLVQGRIILPLAGLVFIYTSFGAPAQGAAAKDNAVANGTWGGEHMILQISEKGAEAEFDCAHGQITQPMALDKRGDFDLAGTYTPEHGGPVLRDEVANPAPARYAGHVAGDTMTLTIVVDQEKLGTFTLTRGQQPMLRKCR